MDQVKVSVIIPIGNVAPYLKGTLDSARNQTLEDIEIICVVDGAADGSAEIVEEYAARDQRIRAIYHQTCMSASKARKDGAAVSVGQYVMFLDGDDELAANACEAAYAAISESRTDILQFGTKVVNDTDDETADMSDLERWTAPYVGSIKGDLIRACFVSRRFPFNLWNKIYDGELCRKAFQSAEDGVFPRANDVYAFFLIASLASSYIGIKTPLYIYHRGRGLYGKNTISIRQFDTFLMQREVYRALKSYTTAQHDDARLAVVENVIKRHFIDECCQKWLTFLVPEDLADGFAHLTDAWGYENVLCSLAEKKRGTCVLEAANKVSDPVFADELRSAAGQIQILGEGRVPDERVLDTVSLDGDIPKVSVIIPVYNSEQYLRDCMDSAIGQTLQNIEILCVNDGSTDSSRRILSEYEKADSRVRVLDKENGGPSSARNLGLSEARGEYIQFLDSDDLLTKDALFTLYRYADYFKTDLLYYGAEIFYETPELEAQQTIASNYYDRNGTYPYTENGRDLLVHMSMDGDFLPSACLQLIRREFLEEQRLRFFEGMVHEDDLFTFEALSLAEQARVLPDARFYVRSVREGSIMTGANYFRRAYGRFKVTYEMDRFIQAHNLAADDPFYRELMVRLFLECDSSLAQLSGMRLDEVWDFAMGIAPEERNAFLLNIYQKKRSDERTYNKFSQFTDLRVDVKNFGSWKNDVVIDGLSEPEAEILPARWMKDEKGHGYAVRLRANSEEEFSFRIVCREKGYLMLLLRGMDVRGDNGSRIPYWMDVMSFEVNGRRILRKPVSVWHDKPYKYSMEVNDGQEIAVSVSVKPHGMGESVPVRTGLKEKLSKVYHSVCGQRGR